MTSALNLIDRRVTGLEELVTFQEQTIEDLNEVVIELRGAVDLLKTQVDELRANAKTTGHQPEEAGGGLPERPGVDPEAPPHY